MKKITIIIFLCGISSIYSQLKFTGYGAAGYRWIDRIRIIEYNQEVYYEGKIQAEYRVNKNIEAQLDLRGNSSDQRVEFREFSAKFSYIKRLDFKFGQLKKPFSAEYLESGEDLIAVERSYLTDAVGNLGYGGRSVGLMAYYKFDKDEKEFPHEYYFFIFKNNNLQNGAVARYSFYPDDDFGASINYFLLNTGGDYPISSSAFALGAAYDKKDFHIDGELMYFQDPVEGQRRQVLKMDDKVFGYGGRLTAAVKLDTDGEVIKDIEPLVLLSYYQPDTKQTDQHTLQALAGANFYFHKDVRLRLNADLLFTKNEFSKKYSTHDSRITIEVQVRY